jgi:hypothetical protein
MFDNTDNWLKERIRIFMGLPADFWYRPFYYVAHYVVERIEIELIEYRDPIYRMGEKVLRYFWEGVWS